jgi:FSR family fosmidomycin resistance protein-like MFS transporter
MSLLGLTDSFWVLVLLVFVAGLSSSIFHVPAPVIVKKFSGNKLGMGLSWYQVGGELARTIGPLIIIGAISLWGLKGTWRLMIFGLLASGFLFVKIRNTKIETNAKKDNKKVKHTLKKYAPLFISITGIVLFRSAMKAALSTFLPVYITSKGQSLWFSGISLSVFQFAGTFGTLFLGSISDKISRKTILIFISVINPILMFLFIVSKGIFLFPILLITGFVLLGSTPIILAMVQEFGSDNLAFVNGIYMTIGFVTSSIMVLFIGFLSDKIGIFLTYRITALLALGAIPFAILLPKTSKKENER